MARYNGALPLLLGLIEHFESEEMEKLETENTTARKGRNTSYFQNKIFIIVIGQHKCTIDTAEEGMLGILICTKHRINAELMHTNIAFFATTINYNLFEKFQKMIHTRWLKIKSLKIRLLSPAFSSI